MNKYNPIAWITNTQTRTIKLFIRVAGKNGEDRRLSVYYPLESSMSSYHVQDLRLILSALDFDLRVNKHCANYSALFQGWLQEFIREDVARVEEWSAHRFDLLCSLCFPTIDPPQLLRISKLCALTFLVNDGCTRAEASPPQWPTGYVPCVEPAFKALTQSGVHSGSTSYSNLLIPEHLLEVARSIRTSQVQELENLSPAVPGTTFFRFIGNLLSPFYLSQETNAQNSHPGLLEFLAVLENTYDRKFSEELINVTPLATLWRCTTKIVMWSQVIRRRKQFLIAGGLTYLTGPRFIHVQAPSNV